MGILSKIGKKVRSMKKYFGKRRNKNHTAQSHANDGNLTNVDNYEISVGPSGLRTVRRRTPSHSLYHGGHKELSVYGGRTRPPDDMVDEVVWGWREVPSSTDKQQMSHADVGMNRVYEEMGYLPQGYRSK